MKKSLTNIYVTHNAKDKTYDEFYNALGTDFEQWTPLPFRVGSRVGIPDGEIENSGKSIFEIQIPNFCYIQVIVFDLKLKHVLYFSQFFHGSVLAKSQAPPLVDRKGQKL